MEQQSKTLIAIIVIIVLVVVGFVFMQSQQSIAPAPTPTEEEQVFCTQDALECPDGSYVGRTGPNCEFVCPDGSVTQ